MSNYLSLTKAFLKSLRRVNTNSKKNKHLYRILLFFTIIFVVIPFLIISASFIYDTTIKLVDINYESIGLKILCYIMCIFTFIFSFSFVLNELFFSNDIEKLLPLPIKPVQLVMSKFTICFIVESVIQVAVIISGIYGYVSALNLSFINVLISLIEILTIPLIPMLYTAMICLLIMHFTKFIRNKENVKKLSIVFVIILIILLCLFINQIKDFNFEAYLQNFVNGDHKFLNVMNIIFPHIDMFTNTLTNGSIISLLEYILINTIYVVLFILLTKKVYFNSVIDLTSKNNNTNKSSTNILKKSKRKNVIISYLSKEFKVLLRTPSFFINCMIINVIWPVIVYVLYQISYIDYSIDKIKGLLSVGDVKTQLILMLLVFIISVLVSSMNSIGATAFSREGKNFEFIKYIPLSYKTQWLIKFLIGFIISFIGINLYLVIFYIMIGFNIVTILELILLSILSISFVCLIGIYIDSVQPRLYWDDENNALRENYNIFISMGICTFIMVVVYIIAYSWLFKKYMFSYNSIYWIVILVLLIINIITLVITKVAGIKNILEHE